MKLIDDEGRIFGFVNLIDALVLLLIAAVVGAGLGMVLQPPPEPETPDISEFGTRHVVLDFGTQPIYLVDQIETGDTYAPSENNALSVTSIYLSPRGGNADVVLTVELTGRTVNGSFTYDGEHLREGRQISIQTDTYQMTGVARDIGTRLQPGTTEVVVVDEVNSTTLADIQEGDSDTVSGYEAATVQSVEVFGTENPDRRRVFVGLSLKTIDVGEGPRYAGKVIRPGEIISMQTDDYVLSGPIRRVGAPELPGRRDTRTVTLELGRVQPYLSSSLETGATETVAGKTNARIVGIERSPDTIAVPADNGTMIARDHPTREVLTLTVELAVRETSIGPTFKGERLQVGDTVVLDLGNVTIRPTVTSLRDQAEG